MRLAKISLENFRCFKSLELELHPRLTVIVGKNGKGKTAILDAIAVGLSPVIRGLSSANSRLSAKSLQDTDIRLEKLNTKKPRWVAAKQTSISVELCDGLEWVVRKRSTAVIPVGQRAKSRKSRAQLLSTLLEIEESIESGRPEPVPVFAYYGAQRGYIEIPQRLRSSQQSYDYPTAALIDCMNAHGNFREMLQWFDMEEVAEFRANKGGRADEYEHSVPLHCVREALKVVLGDNYENPRFNREHKFVVDARVGPSPLYVSQLSQGYQSMLSLAMDFARRLAIGNKHLDPLMADISRDEYQESIDGLMHLFKKLNPDWFEDSDDVWSEFLAQDIYPLLAPGIMLVDEIDLHLHPEWQQRVLADLMRAFPTTQFIVTTHSPQVLSTVPAECVRIINEVAEDEGGETITSVSSASQQTEGVASSSILASIMDIDPVPNVKSTRALSEYISLIQTGDYESRKGLRLRSYLVDHYGKSHPTMLECDRLIRLKEIKKNYLIKANITKRS
ncbi:AAA family ATPase [Pseudomonas oryzihabitans]|uniref:AAA family ATPase n=1 Tax=Pseudomonas oryzihabitans TaxID=47885 RepID=UPI003CF267AC